MGSSLMKCPNCDTVNEENAKFCKTCGINLQDAPVFEENDDETNAPVVDKKVKTTKINNKGDSSDWWMCCICVAAIFIIFVLISMH